MLISAVLLRKQAPALIITALVDSPSVREALHDLGVQQAVSSRELVSRALAAALETPHAGEMLSALVGQRDTFAEVEAGAAAVGKPLSAIRSERWGWCSVWSGTGVNLGLADAGHRGRRPAAGGGGRPQAVADPVGAGLIPGRQRVLGPLSASLPVPLQRRARRSWSGQKL